MAEVRFTKSHEWARIDNDTVTVGITDYAQEQLGDIVFIELPRTAEVFAQGARLATIESTKAASEIYAPLSGQVTGVNADLAGNPQWINESPFEKGWMVKLNVSDRNEFSGLMDEAAYKEFVAKESH
jgi:glycine cleavage system H protein